MALILNLPIFVQNGSHFVCYHGNGGLAEKFNIFFTRQNPFYSLGRECKLRQNPIDLLCLTLKGDQIEVFKILNRYENIDKNIFSHLRKIVELEDMK